MLGSRGFEGQMQAQCEELSLISNNYQTEQATTGSYKYLQIYPRQWFFTGNFPIKMFSLRQLCSQGLLGGPVVKNLPSNAGDVGSIPGQGTKILSAEWHGIQKN